VLTEGPDVTAVIGTHDLLALGVLQAAAALGRRVPADLSVIGIDDIAAAGQAYPPLTTVAFPIARLAQESVDKLLGLLSSRTEEAEVISLAPHLVVRESTAPRAEPSAPPGAGRLLR
jgi:LacI family transcriptional regulator